MIPVQDKKAWLGLSKLGSAGRSPLPLGRIERLWDADQEAVVRPAPPPPALSGLPGWELDPFLCAGARERELRPPVWEQGGQRGKLGRCSSDFWLLPHPEPAAVLAVQPARLRYFALTLHLCLFSTHFTHMTQPHGWQVGRQQAGPEAKHGKPGLCYSILIPFGSLARPVQGAEGTHSTAASFLIPCSTGSPVQGLSFCSKDLGLAGVLSPHSTVDTIFLC